MTNPTDESRDEANPNNIISLCSADGVFAGHRVENLSSGPAVATIVEHPGPLDSRVSGKTRRNDPGPVPR